MSFAASFETPFLSSCCTTKSNWIDKDYLLERGGTCSPWSPGAMLLIALTTLGIPLINPEVEDTILNEATPGL